VKTKLRVTHGILSENLVSPDKKINSENNITCDLEMLSDNLVPPDLEINSKNYITCDLEIISEN
jgi:hypothetical protein